VPGELDDGPSRERLRRRLAQWLERSLRQRLRPLWRAREADLAGPARGLVFPLVANLGVLARAAAAAQLAGLKPADREALARLGVHLGRESIWLPGHGNPAVVSLKRVLWAAHNERPLLSDGPDQTLSLSLEPGLSETGYLALGYRTIGGRAVRVDALERLSKGAHLLARQGAFTPTDALAGLIGCTAEELAPVLQALGFRRQPGDGQATFALRRRGRQLEMPAVANGHTPPRRRRRRPAKVAPGDTPFARLADLRFGK